jgi:DNA ligase-1
MKLKKIKSIKKIQSEERYDIEVEDNHNYFANNILVHNCRCLAHITKAGVELISRQGTKFLGLEHIEKSLHTLHKKYGDIILDGELFSKSISFQEIMSLIRKSKNLSEESQKIEYWVYDIVDETKTFHERCTQYSHMVQGLSYVRETPTQMAKSEDQVFVKHKKFIKDGYEGSIVRTLNGKYKINGRSSDLLKLKDFMDEEFEIIGWKTGKGKFASVPTFIMKTAEGTEFEGVPVGTQEQREQYLKDAKSYIGKKATVRFFEYTTSVSKVPRFPVIYDLDRKE